MMIMHGTDYFTFQDGRLHTAFLRQLTATRPIPIVLVKCWKVAHWNAKKLLKKCQKSKNLLPKFQKLLPKFLAIFI